MMIHKEALYQVYTPLPVPESAIVCCWRVQDAMECEMAAARESFASDVNSFCENHDFCSEARQTTQQHDTAADVEKLTLELDQLETG